MHGPGSIGPARHSLSNRFNLCFVHTAPSFPQCATPSGYNDSHIHHNIERLACLSLSLDWCAAYMSGSRQTDGVIVSLLLLPFPYLLHCFGERLTPLPAMELCDN